MVTAVRFFVPLAFFWLLAVTIAPLYCHGFSPTSTSTGTNTAADTTGSMLSRKGNNDASGILSRKRKRLSLSSFSDPDSGEASVISHVYSANDNNDNSKRIGSRTSIQRIASSVFAGILSAAICTGGVLPPLEAPGGSGFLSLARTRVCYALTPDQLLVDDVWREVGRQFFDPTFNGQGEEGWKNQRSKALQKAADLGPDDDAQLYAIIRKMLQSLNDPYTRFLTPEQFEYMTKTYATNANSKKSADPSEQPATQSTSGIGVQLIGDNRASASGMVVVANTIANGPAAAAGILPGDAIRSVDGLDMIGATAEAVAARCRGATGTDVAVEIDRPPVEGAAATQSNPPSKRLTVVVKRSPLTPLPMIEASTVVVSPNNQRVGVVKINSFTQETEQAVRQELKLLPSGRRGDASTPETTTTPAETVSAIAIDLRGNVGGYMPAGVDVAKMFLPPRARIISEVDKTGRATIYINDGVGSETDTTTPLFVIVDEKTASASEILTAALQDNHRAVVVGGSDKTFGKGRIQNVQALSYGGSGIAITKARYTTPNGRDIQGVGISPDLRSKTCSPKDPAAVCLDGIL